MKNAIIFDIDGTLSDVAHRRHFVTNGNRQWDEFFDAMVNDPPTRVTAIAAIINGWVTFAAARDQTPFKLLVFTGRPDSHRQQTVDQLNNFVPGFLDNAALLMRKTGDYRPDTEVKREMLNKVREHCNPTIVFDDRPSVIAMWKQEGLTVLEHDSGEWDGDKPNVAPGKLTLMVGPSGAGKSTYVMRNFPDDTIVCSDALRTEIGAFNDMSKNTQVFSALRAIVKARIENGFNVVVDATNIHARDRRSIRDEVPENTEIEYIIIDRPLEEKLRDAGWRADVTMKSDKPLVTEHHNSFKSAVKYVLKGDDDPRVTVVDKRQKI